MSSIPLSADLPLCSMMSAQWTISLLSDGALEKLYIKKKIEQEAQSLLFMSAGFPHIISTFFSLCTGCNRSTDNGQIVVHEVYSLQQGLLCIRAPLTPQSILIFSFLLSIFLFFFLLHVCQCSTLYPYPVYPYLDIVLRV